MVHRPLEHWNLCCLKNILKSWASGNNGLYISHQPRSFIVNKIKSFQYRYQPYFRLCYYDSLRKYGKLYLRPLQLHAQSGGLSNLCCAFPFNDYFPPLPTDKKSCKILQSVHRWRVMLVYAIFIKVASIAHTYVHRSPNHRLYRSCRRSLQPNINRSLCNSATLDFAGTDSLRSFHLHGSRKNHHLPPRRTSELCTCPSYDEDLCGWRYSFLYPPRRR